jgi:hypothetical protein
VGDVGLVVHCVVSVRRRLMVEKVDVTRVLSVSRCPVTKFGMVGS